VCVTWLNLFVDLVLVVSPGSPFIASRGGRYLHEGLEISPAEWRSNSPDPVEACPSRLCGELPSPIGVVGVGSAILQSVMLTVGKDSK